MIRGHSAVGDGLYESRQVAGQRSPLSPAQGLLVPAGGLRLPQVQVEVTVVIATADQGRVHAVSSAHWISAAISDVAIVIVHPRTPRLARPFCCPKPGRLSSRARVLSISPWFGHPMKKPRSRGQRGGMCVCCH